MDRTILDIKKFIIREVFKSKWSTEGRSDYYTSDKLSIKKEFDKLNWSFSLDKSDVYYEFKTIGINHYIVLFLLFFVKRNVVKQIQDRKNDKLKSDWFNFLNKNNDKK